MSDELIAGSDEEPEVQRALVELRTWAATAPVYDVAAGEQRFAKAIGAPTDPGGGAAGLGRAKWWIGGAVAAGIVGGAIALQPAREPAPPVAAAIATTEIAAPEGALPHAEPRIESSADTAIEPSMARTKRIAAEPAIATAPAADPPRVARREPPRAAETSRAAKPRGSTETPPPAVETPVIPSEIELVRRLRAAIERDPAAALRTVADLDRHHPRGLLLEERAALEVFALAAAGRDASAKAAARRFAAAHPTSAFATRIDAIARGEDSASDVQENE